MSGTWFEGEIDARHIFGNLFMFYEKVEYPMIKTILTMKCNEGEVLKIVQLLTSMTPEQREEYAKTLVRLEEANAR